MEIHALLSASAVNGPGRRAVVWFQGCTLNCPGCWNPGTHAFDTKSHRTVQDVGDWILSCREIEGATFSGGEPFQQAEALLDLCQYVKAVKPALSLGLFSGYTTRELQTGRWRYRSEKDRTWIPGNAELFEAIRSHVDFGVLGRFSRALATSDKPLCGSRNQEIIFFNERYSREDLAPQACEINISHNGDVITVTGFPPADLLRSLAAR